MVQETCTSGGDVKDKKGIFDGIFRGRKDFFK